MYYSIMKTGVFPELPERRHFAVRFALGRGKALRRRGGGWRLRRYNGKTTGLKTGHYKTAWAQETVED